MTTFRSEDDVTEELLDIVRELVRDHFREGTGFLNIVSIADRVEKCFLCDGTHPDLGDNIFSPAMMVLTQCAFESALDAQESNLMIGSRMVGARSAGVVFPNGMGGSRSGRDDRITRVRVQRAIDALALLVSSGDWGDVEGGDRSIVQSACVVLTRRRDTMVS